MIAEEIAHVFAPGGYLSHLKGYEYRPQQVALAQAVAENLDYLMAEAPTATGKTLAVLVPIIDHALRNRRPAVIATSTVVLQEQLAREAELLRELFPSLRVALLKGKSHYLCPLRLAGHLEQSELEEKLLYLTIAQAYAAGKGERSQMPTESLAVWEEVDASHCLMQTHCEGCPLREARERARASDLIIANHALLLADAESQMVLPQWGELVVDEAHKLEDAATSALSFRLLVVEPDCFNLVGRLGLGEGLGHAVLILLRSALTQVEEGEDLPKLILPSHSWASLCNEYSSLDLRLCELRAQLESMRSDLPARRALQMEALFALEKLMGQLRAFFAIDDNVRWVEENNLRYSPLKVGGWLAQHLWSRSPATLVSATLKRLDGFGREALGLPPGRDLVLPPVFDYRRQCLLCLPDCPSPDEEGYLGFLAMVLEDLYRALGGSILCLFTANQTMRDVALLLRGRVPILVQGQDGERSVLIEQFKRGGTVLLGSGSFWEGIDLVGDSLRALVVAKLPFDVPSEPLHRARSRLCASPFMEYALPRAAMRLRQGFGRLIRSSSDRGICLILDNRLRRRRYGRTLLQSLPDCPVYLGNDIEAETRLWFGLPSRSLVRRSA